MNAKHDRLLEEQILSVLNNEWRNCFGDSSAINPDTTLKEVCDQWNASLSIWDPDPLDLNDYLCNVELKLGLQIEKREWDRLLGQNLLVQSESVWEEFAHEWTVRQLITFLREHLPEVSFDPVNICGKDCAPAGVFFGLRDLAQHHLKSDIRMGPSSKLCETLNRTAFLRFWRQLRLFTQDRVPQLIPRTKKVQELLRLGLQWSVVYAAVAACGLAFELAGLKWLWLIIPSAFANWIHWAILKDPDYGFLPDGIQTFRDLAEYISRKPETVSQSL